MAQPLVPAALPGAGAPSLHQQPDGSALRPAARRIISVHGVPCTAWCLDADGSPVWACREGEELRPGLRAWQRLGVGLRCETWLAWTSSGCCPVAVKLPRPHQVQHARAWASLTREVYVLTRAHHPVLPQLYGDRLDTEVPHLIMEYVDGPALDQELEEAGPMPAAAAALLAAHLLAALVAVHATGAAHLDIKPENIVIRDGRPILLDFGSARPLGSRQPPGRPVGTDGYAAPEMEACLPGAASMDVYGVGVVLAEALGRPRRCLHDPEQYPRRQRGLRRQMSWIAERLVDPDPSTRPSVAEGLELLSGAVGPGRLWPSWVEHQEVGCRSAELSSRIRAQ